MSPRAADETEGGGRGADPLRVRVDLNELATELKRVLLRRLGASSEPTTSTASAPSTSSRNAASSQAEPARSS